MKNRMGCLLIAALLLSGSCSQEPSEEPTGSSDPMVTTESDDATLKTPAEVGAGSAFQVGWTGPDAQRDYITIVEKGAPKGSYQKYTYTSKGSPLELTAGDTPGAFEVRYISGETKETLVAAPITVNEVKASLDAPGEVGAGASFDVVWTGPDNKSDYITIVEKGASQGKYLSYTYTRKGSPLQLSASEEPGAYEVRYVMGQSKRILASRGISVSAVDATLSASEEAMVEAPIEVAWTGPGNDKDYITVVEAGAPQATHGAYTYTRKGSPLTVKAPKTPGVFEIRYVMGQSKKVLVSRQVTVKPLGATLKAPREIAPGASLEVHWTGPNNPKDFIAVAKKEAAGKSFESRAYSRAGNPAKLFAPSTVGTYELRYVLSKGNSVLTSVPIKVVSPQP